MKLSDFIKKMVRDYFIIFAIIVIFITILRQLFSPGEYFELKDIFIYMICALAGDLPSLIFYSSKEQSQKVMRLRLLIHFAVLEVVLLTLTTITGWVTGWLQTIIFAAQIAVIYLLVRFLSYNNDRKSAHKINDKLKAMREGSKDSSEK